MDYLPYHCTVSDQVMLCTNITGDGRVERGDLWSGGGMSAAVTLNVIMGYFSRKKPITPVRRAL